MATAFEEVVVALTPVAVRLLTQATTRRGSAVATSCCSLLAHLARELEDVCPRNVSRAAHQKAQELGLGDLRRFHWDDRAKEPLRRYTEVFHWEHFWPVGQLLRDLEGLARPTEQSVAAILSRTKIVWVLKVEDRRLPKSIRPNPDSAYATAGIVLMHAWLP